MSSSRAKGLMNLTISGEDCDHQFPIMKIFPASSYFHPFEEKYLSQRPIFEQFEPKFFL
jgi:hypothetical protein